MRQYCSVINFILTKKDLWTLIQLVNDSEGLGRYLAPADTRNLPTPFKNTFAVSNQRRNSTPGKHVTQFANY